MSVLTKTTLTFGANTTDKGDCGSASSLDNLASGTMTVLTRIKRNATGNNQFMVSKYNAGAAGWYIQLDDGSGTGEVAAAVGRASTDAFRLTDTAGNAANGCPVGTLKDVGFTWDIGDTPTIRIYLAAVGSELVESTAYDGISQNGSGAVNNDASANLYIGNLQVAPTNPVKADMEWVAIFNKKLTAAERLTVQMGWDRNNAAMITAIGGCVLLHQLNATGTLTDLSGQGNSCTITGATTTTGETIWVPTVWAESPTAVDKTDFLDPGSHGKARCVTDATSVTLGLIRSTELSSTFDNQAAISVEVNGAYDSQAVVTTAGTKQYVVRSLPAGSGKAISFINSVHTRTGSAGTGSDVHGVSLISARFNNTVTETSNTTPTTNIVTLNDSIIEGFKTNPVGQFGPLDLLRRWYAGTPQIVCHGYGGHTLYKLAVDATARSNTASDVASLNPTMILINLGTNDYTNNLWSAASFETAAAALLVALNSACPSAVIRVATPATLPSGEGANGSGSTLGNYRTAWVNAASGKSYVTVYDGPTQLWDGTNADADNTHPNNTGAAAIFDNLKTITTQPAGGGSASPYYLSYYSRLVLGGTT